VRKKEKKQPASKQLGGKSIRRATSKGYADFHFFSFSLGKGTQVFITVEKV